VIEAGSSLPDALVWVEPGGDAVRLPELAAGGPFLLLVYLYDWTGT
jgi:hypothetical protein